MYKYSVKADMSNDDMWPPSPVICNTAEATDG